MGLTNGGRLVESIGDYRDRRSAEGSPLTLHPFWGMLCVYDRRKVVRLPLSTLVPRRRFFHLPPPPPHDGGPIHPPSSIPVSRGSGQAMLPSQVAVPAAGSEALGLHALR